MRKINFFRENVLQVENASVYGCIDRAHRIGAFSGGKTSIVDKSLIQSSQHSGVLICDKQHTMFLSNFHKKQRA